MAVLTAVMETDSVCRVRTAGTASAKLDGEATAATLLWRLHVLTTKTMKAVRYSIVYLVGTLFVIKIYQQPQYITGLCYNITIFIPKYKDHFLTEFLKETTGLPVVVSAC